MDYFFQSINKRKSTSKANRIKGFALSCLSVALHLIAMSAFSQNPNLGIPPTINYSKKSFNAGSQNRALTYHNGRIYSANNGGLLVYDGIKWTVFKTPENSILRSLAPSAGDTIYVGGQGELGLFKPDNRGNLQYESLIDQLPEQYQNLGEIWEMSYVNSSLFVKITGNHILELKENGTYNTYIHQNPIGRVASIDDNIYYQVSGVGLFSIKDGNSALIPNSEALKDYEVRSFHRHNEVLYIVTRNKGIFQLSGAGLQRWETNIDPILETAIINNSTISPAGYLILATQKKGLIQIDSNGKAIIILTKDNGLQSNSSYSLTLTDSGSLWASVGTGIDQINLNTNSTKFYPDGDLEGAVYDIEKWNGYFWYATSNGLYHIKEKDYYNPNEDLKFVAKANTEGNVWGLNVIDNHLFCGHENGTIVIDKDLHSRWLLKGIGSWMYTELNPTLIAAGTYLGVYLLSKNNGRWEVNRMVKGLDESSRIMAKDKENVLWVAHPYLQVYNIQFSKDYKTSTISTYDKDSGLMTNLRNYVFVLDGVCYVSNETGVYTYNYAKDRFEIAQLFNNAYPEGNYLRSVIKKNESIWAISHGGTHKLSITYDSVSQELGTDINTDDNYIGGFENLYAYDDNTILTCSDNGVMQYASNHTPATPQMPILTSTLLLDNQDSVLHHGYGKITTHQLEGSSTAIRFDFNSLESSAYKVDYYRYFLEGIDTEWSPWTNQPFKVYHQLEPGDYKFMVRAVGADSSEGPISEFSFSIATPLSQSWWAVLFYALCLLAAGLLLLLIPRKKYQENTIQLEAEKAEAEAEKLAMEKEKNRIAEEKRKADLEVLEAQRKMELLEKEKLENEILFKNKELAMSTMNLLSKSETLDVIRSGMEQIEKKVTNVNTKKEIKKILSLLRSDDRLEDEWSNFSIHFDKAHHDFLKRLKTEYPKLTPKDQKLCAYLRMNLSTKEIAPLLKISVRGVEISRYRLRKKIELAKEVNLNEFMMEF